jgi:asmA family protein
MKKVFITLGVLILVVITALMVIPTFFKGDILQIIEKQSAKYINAKLKIGDMNLSMFKSFPNLNVALKEVMITGQDEFAGDTVVYIPLFEASVNLKSLIAGDELIVNQLLLKNCRIAPTVNSEGKAKWDILLSSGSQTSATTETPPDEPKGKAERGLRLNDIAIENLFITYNDFQHSTYASIADIDLKLNGNFSETNTLIDIFLALQNISYRHQNSVWINKTDLKWQAVIGANLKEMTFDIQKNDLALNDLKLDLTGNIGIGEDKYKLDLQLNAPDTKFASLLAMVPKTLQHYIEGLETSGDFKLNVTAKGEYYADHLPALQANLLVNNASVKYPELPEAIRQINIDLNVSNPGGPVDSTQLNLKKLSFDIAGNPFSMYLNISNPNDPVLAGGAVGVINFSNLKKALPLKDITLQGIVTTDMTFNGKYQYIEKEQYEKFIAKGNIILKDLLLVNAEFPEGISIPQGSVTITPAQLNLKQLQAKVFSSDFTLQGNISNYLPYVFKNETLKGNFSLHSNRINLNEFIIAQAKAARQTKSDTTARASADSIALTNKPTAAEGALEIPKNIDVQFTSNISTILFDNLTIRNVKGQISLDNAVATLKNLSMDMLEGKMVMNGQYNTANPKIPTVDFKLNISDFDIHAAYEAFTFLRKSIPVAMNCSGQVSAAMNFSSALDKEMSPVMTTANGGGYLESKGILINDNPAMNQLASVMKNDELSRLSISKLKIDFKLENGNIIVEPFKTSFAGNPVTIYGNQTVDGQLDYTLSMNIDRKFFGKDIDNLLKSIPGSDNIKNLDIDAKVEGTLSKPVIKPDLSKAIKAVTKAAEKELKGNLLQGIQNLFKKK